jgi:hypothetical protein
MRGQDEVMVEGAVECQCRWIETACGASVTVNKCRNQIKELCTRFLSWAFGLYCSSKLLSQTVMDGCLASLRIASGDGRNGGTRPAIGDDYRF